MPVYAQADFNISKKMKLSSLVDGLFLSKAFFLADKIQNFSRILIFLKIWQSFYIFLITTIFKYLLLFLNELNMLLFKNRDKF